MFGKRKGREQVQQPGEGTRSSRVDQPSSIGTLATVIVPRSAVARANNGESPYDLVQALVNFVNVMTGEGLYSRFELPAKAMQAYHADFYLAQVNNGGHSQFIHNSFANLPFIVKDVRAALEGMKADAVLAIFERMAAWVAQNPDEVTKQTGFDGGRAPLLDELDKLFYAADKAAPLIAQNARWIASWPELRAVDDADYPEAIRRAATLNPLREARLVTRSVENLRTQMTEWLHVGIGLACATGPSIEIKLAIGGGAAMDVEGEQQMVFHVRTNADTPRLCVVTKTYAAAYERVEANNPPMPDMNDIEGMKQAIADGRLAQYKGPSAGRKLSHVKSEAIAGVIELASEYGAPVALDLLLRRAGIETGGAVVAPMSIEPKVGGAIVNWVVAAGGQALFAMSHPNGSALLRPGDNKHLATVRKSEIAEHAARVEAGTIKLP